MLKSRLIANNFKLLMINRPIERFFLLQNVHITLCFLCASSLAFQNVITQSFVETMTLVFGVVYVRLPCCISASVAVNLS